MPKRGERLVERVQVTCPCGTVFEVRRLRYEQGRGRRCSKECQNKYATRRSGLTYVMHRDNPGWFKPGPRTGVSPRKGHEPWNKGVKTGTIPPNAFKPAPVLTYGALHQELRRQRGPASIQTCTQADETCLGRIEWANISGNYEGVDDFEPLCRSHHVRHDKAAGFWGSTGPSWPGRPRE